MTQVKNEKVLNAITSTTTSKTIDSEGHFNVVVTAIGTDLTQYGATFHLQASPDGDNWTTLVAVGLSTNNTTHATLSGEGHRYYRVDTDDYTDGTWTVWLTFTGNPDRGY